MDLNVLPLSIRKRVAGKPCTVNTTGMSGSEVVMFPEWVLKISRPSPLTDGMVQVMRWLEGRLPAPRVLALEKAGGMEYLLMTRVRGSMACSREYLSRPSKLVTLLAEAIHMLWRVDIASCPVSRSLEYELARARENLEAGKADFSRAEPETFGPGGFESPEKLLRWLEENQPPLEPAFSHGDLCLPNIFFAGDTVSGFIDLGDAGIADKWRDLALCFRSLKHNTNGTYGYLSSGFRPDTLFDALGIRPDREKLRYYTLLDEFF